MKFVQQITQQGLGFGTMDVIGGIVFVIGTVLFVVEVMGYRLSVVPLRFTRSGVKWTTMALVIVAVSAAIYGGGLAATAGIPIVPGYNWFRPANALTPVLGILFGVPGAVGAGLGNLIADTLGGYLSLGSIAGFIGNFLNAYIPYLIVRKATQADLSSVSDWVRFYFSVVAAAFVLSFYIGFFLNWLKLIPPQAIWIGFFGSAWFNILTTGFILSPILLKLLLPYVRKMGLYAAESEGSQFQRVS